MRALPLTLFALAAIPAALATLALRPPPVPPTVNVTATDYALAAPDALREGAVRFQLTNRGKEFHHLWVVRLEQGKTLDDFRTALSPAARFQPGPARLGGPMPRLRRAGRPMRPWCWRPDGICCCAAFLAPMA